MTRSSLLTILGMSSGLGRLNTKQSPTPWKIFSLWKKIIAWVRRTVKKSMKQIFKPTSLGLFTILRTINSPTQRIPRLLFWHWCPPNNSLTWNIEYCFLCQRNVLLFNMFQNAQNTIFYCVSYPRRDIDKYKRFNGQNKKTLYHWRVAMIFHLRKTKYVLTNITEKHNQNLVK